MERFDFTIYGAIRLIFHRSIEFLYFPFLIFFALISIFVAEPSAIGISWEDTSFSTLLTKASILILVSVLTCVLTFLMWQSLRDSAVDLYRRIKEQSVDLETIGSQLVANRMIVHALASAVLAMPLVIGAIMIFSLTSLSSAIPDMIYTILFYLLLALLLSTRLRRLDFALQKAKPFTTFVLSFLLAIILEYLTHLAVPDSLNYSMDGLNLLWLFRIGLFIAIGSVIGYQLGARKY